MRRHVHQLTPGEVFRDLAFVLFTIAVAIIVAIALASCTAVPKDFKPGAKVEPPQGCIDQRKRNPNAEC